VNTAVTSSGVIDDSSVHIESVSDATRIRRDLIKHIWGSRGYPFSLQPKQVDFGVASPVAPLADLQRVDRLVIEMDHGFATNAYVFRPIRDNERLVIWHMGHSSDLGIAGGQDTIQHMLSAGFTVIGLWMPGYGESTGPLTNHDQVLSSFPAGSSMHDGLEPIRFFLEPTIASINWAEANGFADVSMIGLSGGGWTTTVMAALDARIKYSVPVAGSLPLYMRTSRDEGDSEQRSPGLFRIAGYPDLHTLAALEPNRAQLQVLNLYDSCCFAGIRYREYEPKVKTALTEIGDTGTWNVYLDETHYEHQVSRYALDTQIMAFLLSDN
jgi:hypothetical protein